MLTKYQEQINWLLTGDPSVEYFTHRDLLRSDNETIKNAREKINKQGWCRKILDLQDKEGTWSKALYSPKWISTTYSLLLLKRLGAMPSDKIIRACSILLEKNRAEDGGIDYWKTRRFSDVCVTAMLLSVFVHFRIENDYIHKMKDFLLATQMKDKGWNCEHYRGAAHSSFHTTISVLEGLWDYQKAYDPYSGELKRYQDEGTEFLLDHKLYKSSTTGKIVSNKMTRFTFPPRWKYDVMRALDYMQERNMPKDERFTDSIELVRKREKNGYWYMPAKHPGRVFFDLEPAGKPSRINTLRALRVLKWWENK